MGSQGRKKEGPRRERPIQGRVELGGRRDGHSLLTAPVPRGRPPRSCQAVCECGAFTDEGDGGALAGTLTPMGGRYPGSVPRGPLDRVGGWEVRGRCCQLAGTSGNAGPHPRLQLRIRFLSVLPQAWGWGALASLLAREALAGVQVAVTAVQIA